MITLPRWHGRNRYWLVRELRSICHHRYSLPRLPSDLRYPPRMETHQITTESCEMVVFCFPLYISASFEWAFFQSQNVQCLKKGLGGGFVYTQVGPKKYTGGPVVGDRMKLTSADEGPLLICARHCLSGQPDPWHWVDELNQYKGAIPRPPSQYISLDDMFGSLPVVVVGSLTCRGQPDSSTLFLDGPPCLSRPSRSLPRHPLLDGRSRSNPPLSQRRSPSLFPISCNSLGPLSPEDSLPGPVHGTVEDNYYFIFIITFKFINF